MAPIPSFVLSWRVAGRALASPAPRLGLRLPSAGRPPNATSPSAGRPPNTVSPSTSPRKSFCLRMGAARPGAAGAASEKSGFCRDAGERRGGGSGRRVPGAPDSPPRTPEPGARAGGGAPRPQAIVRPLPSWGLAATLEPAPCTRGPRACAPVTPGVRFVRSVPWVGLNGAPSVRSPGGHRSPCGWQLRLGSEAHAAACNGRWWSRLSEGAAWPRRGGLGRRRRSGWSLWH